MKHYFVLLIAIITQINAVDLIVNNKTASPVDVLYKRGTGAAATIQIANLSQQIIQSAENITEIKIRYSTSKGTEYAWYAVPEVIAKTATAQSNNVTCTINTGTLYGLTFEVRHTAANPIRASQSPIERAYQRLGTGLNANSPAYMKLGVPQQANLQDITKTYSQLSKRYAQEITDSQERVEMERILSTARDAMITQLRAAPLSDSLKSVMAKTLSYAGQAGYDKSQIQQEVLLGALLQNVIIQRDTATLTRLKESYNMNQLVTALIWFYYGIALAKDQGFEEGTFVVFDTTDGIYKFLASHPNAYDRASTHYTAYAKYLRLERKHKGLDVQRNPLYLPAAKGTILFGMVNPQEHRIFIKPENFGTQASFDLAQHGGELVLAQLRKLQHNLPADYAKMTAEYLGTDEDEGYRKERVPTSLFTAFVTILNKLVDYKVFAETEDIKTYLDQAAALGVSSMYTQAEAFKKLVDASMRTANQENRQQLAALANEIEQFRNTIATKYAEKAPFPATLNLRTGNEVIITPETIARIVSGNDVTQLKRMF